VIDDIPPRPTSSAAPSLDYESPQTRQNQRRPPPAQSVGRLWAAAAVIFSGAFAMHATLTEGDAAQGFGGTVIVVGLLLFVVEFILVWWRRPR
jgi:hypothetical protein